MAQNDPKEDRATALGFRGYAAMVGRAMDQVQQQGQQLLMDVAGGFGSPTSSQAEKIQPYLIQPKQAKPEGPDIIRSKDQAAMNEEALRNAGSPDERAAVAARLMAQGK